MWIMERLGFWRFLCEPTLAGTEGPMMKTLPLLLIATLSLCACGGDDEGNSAGNLAGGAKGGAAAQSVKPGTPIAAGDSLTGLYEKKEGGLSSQLCIVERGQGAARFGLNIWGGNMHACSGSGTREGGKLTLAMEGDRACTVTATIEGDAIRLPSDIPEACNYYCGEQAKMAGVSLARTGNSQADALKARDVVDEPLCDAAKG
jgi:hypothetical protein